MVKLYIFIKSMGFLYQIWPKRTTDNAKSIYITKKPPILPKHQRRSQESRLGSPTAYTCDIASQFPYLDMPLMNIAPIAPIYDGHSFRY